jgi:D-alanine-D-alanine ligase-like ATP-grasp enzyme
MKKPFVTTLLQKLAPELGFKLLVEPQWQQLGEIEFANGRKHFFLKTDLGINNSASAAIAKDKAYTKFLLKNVGIGVAEGRAFSSDRLNKRAGIDNGLNSGMRYAAELEYPLYVKPNDLDYGELVVKVYSWNELRSVALYIFERTDTLLIEKAVSGRDFRVLVYNGRWWQLMREFR